MERNKMIVNNIPDISNDEILCCRMALRHQLKFPLTKDSFADYHTQLIPSFIQNIKDIENLFERTVAYGENQSGILIGAKGSGKKHIVTKAMKNLQERYPSFRCIYLNGTILQNELEAFKEMIAQLTQDRNIKHPNLAYWTMYEYLKTLLKDKANANERIILLLDNFESFANTHQSNKQLLLYNLLNWLQTNEVQMGVLGITSDYNVMEYLEKRVRSRFSKLQILVTRPPFSVMAKHLVKLLSLRAIPWTSPMFCEYLPPSVAFQTYFDSFVSKLFLESSAFYAALEFDYDIGYSQEYFLTLASNAVCYLSRDEPILAPSHFQMAKKSLAQDHQLETLKSLSDLGIALLFGMVHLEKEGRQFMTFAMIYDRFQQFYRRHDIFAQLPTRMEALDTMDTLLSLDLVKNAGDAFHIGRVKYANTESLSPEYRVVHLNFPPRKLELLIKKKILRCSTITEEWALNGL